MVNYVGYWKLYKICKSTPIQGFQTEIIYLFIYCFFGLHFTFRLFTVSSVSDEMYKTVNVVSSLYS